MGETVPKNYSTIIEQWGNDKSELMNWNWAVTNTGLRQALAQTDTSC